MIIEGMGMTEGEFERYIRFLLAAIEKPSTDKIVYAGLKMVEHGPAEIDLNENPGAKQMVKLFRNLVKPGWVKVEELGPKRIRVTIQDDGRKVLPFAEREAMGLKFTKEQYDELVDGMLENPDKAVIVALWPLFNFGPMKITPKTQHGGDDALAIYQDLATQKAVTLQEIEEGTYLVSITAEGKEFLRMAGEELGLC